MRRNSDSPEPDSPHRGVNGVVDNVDNSLDALPVDELVTESDDTEETSAEVEVSEAVDEEIS